MEIQFLFVKCISFSKAWRSAHCCISNNQSEPLITICNPNYSPQYHSSEEPQAILTYVFELKPYFSLFSLILLLKVDRTLKVFTI